MKKLLLLSLLTLFFGCKQDDPDPITQFLGNYYDTVTPAVDVIDYFKIGCASANSAAASNAIVEKMDNQTLKITFRYVGGCLTMMKSTLTAPIPTVSGSEIKIDFTGVCESTQPNDPNLVGKTITGFAYLSAKSGKFTLNLPVSVNGKSQQIVANHNDKKEL